MARMLRPLQNTGRSGTKHTSEHVGHRARDAKNKQKSAQQLPGQRFLLRAHDNEVLERSGADFLPGLDVSRAPLGRLLGALGALLGALGHLLGASWAHLWCSWAPLGCQLLPKMGSGSIFHRFGLDSDSIWGSIWGRRASFLGRTLTSCRRIDMVREFLQETHIEIHSGFSFSPCSAAVRAQHME